MDCAMCLRPLNQQAYDRRTAQAVLGAIVLDGVTKPVSMTTIVRRCWRMDRAMPIRMIQQALQKLHAEGRITEAKGTYESTFKLTTIDRPAPQRNIVTEAPEPAESTTSVSTPEEEQEDIV